VADAVLASTFSQISPSRGGALSGVAGRADSSIRMTVPQNRIAHMNSVLEVGCGGGRFEELQERFRLPRDLILALCRTQARRRRSGERLPFKPATFQAYFPLCPVVVPDMNALFAEVRRVLSPGGL